MPWRHTIILRGRLSVITTLHEAAHVLFGAPERTAVAWSLAMFQACFPLSFAKLTFRGQIARTPHERQPLCLLGSVFAR